MKYKFSFLFALCVSLIMGMTNVDWQNFQIFRNSANTNNIIPPYVDTTYPISPYGEGAGYFDGASFVFKRGDNVNINPLVLNWSSTNTAVIELNFRPLKKTSYYILGKGLLTSYACGYVIYWNSKTNNVVFAVMTGSTLVERNVCVINDTNNYHYVKLSFDKSDSTLKTYHGDGINTDTLIYRYREVVWNSNFHDCWPYSFVIGGHQLRNPDCTGTNIPSHPEYMFKGYMKYCNITVNDTGFHWDFKNNFSDHIYDPETYFGFDRSYSAGAKHLQNGNTYSYSRNDVKWIGNKTRLYPVLWDTVLFQPGLQNQYIYDSNLCESFVNSKAMVVKMHDTDMVVCGGQFNRANSTGWDAGSYNYISPRVTYYNINENKWKSVGYGFNQLGGSISRAFDTLNGQLIIGGYWSHTYADTTQTALGDTLNNIAQFDLDTGTVARQMAKGLNSQVLEIKNWRDTIYAGGSFTDAYNVHEAILCSYIVQWNGSSWKALIQNTPGVNNVVWAMETYNGKLVAAGSFTDRGTKIASWDGTVWLNEYETNNPFGNGTVYDLWVDKYNNLWAGGTFGIAYWNGSTWIRPFTLTGGSSLTTIGNITEITSYENILFFTGSFTRANGKFMKMVGAYNILTGELYNIGTIDMRGESILIYNHPVQNKPYLVYLGDGYNVESDGFKFGNVVALDLEKIGIYVGISSISNTVPRSYVLYQNYPNPFNPVTNIKFDIANTSVVKLVVYDVLGREVKTIVNEYRKPGTYLTQFDGTNFASGVYFYRIEVRQTGSSTVDYVMSKKMVLVK